MVTNVWIICIFQLLNSPTILVGILFTFLAYDAFSASNIRQMGDLAWSIHTPMVCIFLRYFCHIFMVIADFLFLSATLKLVFNIWYIQDLHKIFDKWKISQYEPLSGKRISNHLNQEHSQHLSQCKSLLWSPHISA